MNKICFGCGKKLQTDNEEEAGFIPSHKLEDAKYCQRCYKMMHYGKVSETSTPKKIKSIITSINNDDKYVLFLVDFLSISNKVLDIFKSIKNKKILIISKCDIIPESIKDSTIKNFLRDYYDIHEDIKLISAKTNYGVLTLNRYLFDHKIFNAYIVGLSNSGKSTLINRLIDINNSKLNHITTNYMPNTTLDFIRLQISPNLLLIDSPGFIIPSLSFNSKETLKKEMKPKTYQMRKNETIFINDLYFNFINDTSITLYMDNNLKSFKDYKQKAFSYSIDVEDNSDLIIMGLGFINIKKASKVYLYNVPEELTEIRTSIFGE